MTHDSQCEKMDSSHGCLCSDRLQTPAAPELLEALERLRNAEKAPREEWVAALLNADAVIAKAKGETK